MTYSDLSADWVIAALNCDLESPFDHKFTRYAGELPPLWYRMGWQNPMDFYQGTVADLREAGRRYREAEAADPLAPYY